VQSNLLWDFIKFSGATPAFRSEIATRVGDIRGKAHETRNPFQRGDDAVGEISSLPPSPFDIPIHSLTHSQKKKKVASARPDWITNTFSVDRDSLTRAVAQHLGDILRQKLIIKYIPKQSLATLLDIQTEDYARATLFLNTTAGGSPELQKLTVEYFVMKDSLRAYVGWDIS
jgi:hypothetical protein